MFNLKRAVLGIFGLLGILSFALSANATSSDIRLSSTRTEDSILTFSGTTEKTGSMMLLYSKGGVSKQVVTAIENGVFSTPFLLELGPGTYSINIFHCRPQASSCSFLKKLEDVINFDSRKLNDLTLTESDAFAVESGEILDSATYLSGKLPEDTYLLVKILHLQSGTYERAEFQAAQDQFRTKLYFSQGEGTYRLTFFACPSDPEKGSICTSTGQGFLQVKNKDQRTFESYLLPSEQIQSDDPTLLDLALRITRAADTPQAALTAIHAWVTSRISYDAEALFSGAYSRMPWDAATVLERKTAICAGYANLTAALLRAVNIPARVVSGYADVFLTESGASTLDRARCQKSDTTSDDRPMHAWNEVLIDGEWVSVDTTWDAGFIDSRSRKFVFSPQLKYFMNPEAFARDHLACFIDQY